MITNIAQGAPRPIDSALRGVEPQHSPDLAVIANAAAISPTAEAEEAAVPGHIIPL